MLGRGLIVSVRPNILKASIYRPLYGCSQQITPEGEFKPKDFFKLTKFSLSVANAGIAVFCYGYNAAEVSQFSMWDFSITFSASLLMAMSSQVCNQVMEQKYDGVMTRTCLRPIPQKKISTYPALLLGFGLFGIANWIFYKVYSKYSTPEALVVANSIFGGYVCIYSPLKRVSAINTKIGALVGALPAILGPAAITFTRDEKENSILPPYINVQTTSIFTFMFAWQFNHFYGIYWMYQKDYIRAGFKMLDNPVTAAKEMRVMCFLAALSWLGLSYQSDSWIAPVSLGIGGYSLYKYNWLAINEFLENPSKNAKALKMASYNYYMLFFGCAVVDLALKQIKPWRKELN